MVTVVLVLNVVISLCCWYAVWRIWQLRRALARATNALIIAERTTHQVLRNAPKSIVKQQTGVHGLRVRYQQAIVQLQQVRQILSLLGLGQVLLRRYTQTAAIRRSSPAPTPAGFGKKTKKPRMTYF